jgi:nitrate reductase NapE
MSVSTSEHNDSDQKKEAKVLLFLTFVLAPMLAVAFVGGYGFLIWIFQMFAGPPGSLG